MVIALFEHRLRSNINIAEWQCSFDRMVALAVAVPGFVSLRTYSAADSTALAVVRFDSEDALHTWRSHPAHIRTQQRGREAFFESYRMTVTTAVVREYAWSR